MGPPGITTTGLLSAIQSTPHDTFMRDTHIKNDNDVYRESLDGLFLTFFYQAELQSPQQHAPHTRPRDRDANGPHEPDEIVWV